MTYVACSLCEPPCYGDCRMGDAGYEQAVALAQAAARIAALTEAMTEARRLIGFMTNAKIAEAARVLEAALVKEDRK